MWNRFIFQDNLFITAACAEKPSMAKTVYQFTCPSVTNSTNSSLKPELSALTWKFWENKSFITTDDALLQPQTPQSLKIISRGVRLHQWWNVVFVARRTSIRTTWGNTLSRYISQVNLCTHANSVERSSMGRTVWQFICQTPTDMQGTINHCIEV